MDDSCWCGLKHETSNECDEFWEDFKKGTDELKQQILDQEELERLDPPGRIRMESPGIFWCVKPKYVWVKGEKDQCVFLEWGWGAELSDEELKATDCPQDRTGLIVSKEQAIELRDRLNKLLGE